MRKSKTTKEILKSIPILRSTLSSFKNLIRPKKTYIFSRDPIQDSINEEDRTLRKVGNLLNYTKTNKQAYAAERFSSGYHSIKVAGRLLKGQRNPLERIDNIPLDFKGKSVLDLGCNQGGMLHSIGKTLENGIGIDYDYRMINVANRIAKINSSHNLSFYVLDLDQDPLELIEDLLPDTEINAVFFLAVAMWIERWKDVIIFSKKISNTMIFESNGSNYQQQSQVDFLKTQYDNVEQISGDPGKSFIERWRTMYHCH